MVAKLNKSTSEGLLKRLEKPKGCVDVVLDTDAYNEVDDQYALAYLIKSQDKLNLKAIYAAPFTNTKADTAKEGMEKSFDEIGNILQLMEREDLKPIVRKGSTEYLSSECEAVSSPAAEDLVKRAKKYTSEKPLYVIAIGAITNVASAILMDSSIVDKIVIVWLGGHALHWPINDEFNLYQDVAAARIVLGCGAAVVLLPCKGVVSAFTTSGPEVEFHLKGKNKLCDYLVEYTEKEAMLRGGNHTWSRPVWDVTAVAWLLDGDFMEDYLMPSPIPEYDDRYAIDPTRHLIRYVYTIKRDNLFADLFGKLIK